jgi:magnesium transporter
MTVMRTWLDHGDATVEDPDPSVVADLTARDIPFWLDVQDPTDDVIDRLAEALGLHPLAVEDSKEFDQRGKVIVYGDVMMFVGFGMDPGADDPVEVHAYLSERYLVTMRRAPSAVLDTLHRTGALREVLGGDPVRTLHRLVTSLHDEFPAYIDRLEDRLDAVEAEMLDEPLDRHLLEITAVRRAADRVRRILTPGRDVAARTTVLVELPGATTDAALYAGDIADELRLMVSDLAAIGDRCLAALGLHAAMVGNRQGAASRQLAAVATVFLPITFVVGFFGMNFDVLVADLERGWPVFLLLGVALNVICIVVTLWWLGRRGWR